jgi:acyl carrier protein
MSKVHDRIVEILAEQALIDPSEVKPESTMADLGLDSLGLVESIFAIEEAFDIHVPYNASEPSESDIDISSVATVVAAIEKLVAEKV